MTPDTVTESRAALRRSLYAAMLRLRLVEERIADIYPLQEVRCPTHLYVGQEAVAAGVCATLRPDDFVFPFYRSHGWYLAKGGDFKAMMAELFGRATGCSGGWGGSMHLIDVGAGVMGSSALVAGGIPHAVGAALAARQLGLDAVSVSTFGDGASEEGVFHESMAFAALKKLPVVFICENNAYATYASLLERQPQVPISRRADGCGIPGVVVDGNDVLEVYETAQVAVDRARRGAGPTLIECRTYRWLEHCGPNDDTELGYRSPAELNEWKTRCPIQRARPFISDEDDARLRAQIGREIDEAIALARATPFPRVAFRDEGGR